MPKSSPISQCAFGVKSKCRGVPIRRNSTASSSFKLTGTSGWGMFGKCAAISWTWASTVRRSSSNVFTSALTFCISAISALASSLFRFFCEISPETWLRVDFNCSLLAINSRRFSSAANKSSMSLAATPRWPSCSFTKSGFWRIILTSNITTSPFHF